MATEKVARTYKGLFRLDEPVRVWTPDGGYNAPRLIAVAKTPKLMDLSHTINYLKNRSPPQRPFTSGEWHQVREALCASNSAIEDDMITGAYERISTLVDYDHGLVIQIPDSDADGNLLTDEKGIIKGRHTWEMALPQNSDFVKNTPKDLMKFFNTIYGMEDAARQLPNYAYFWIYDEPTGVKNLVRGDWLFGSRKDRRVCVHGYRWPSGSREYVASRGAAEDI